MIKKRGYKPLITASMEIKNLIDNLNAHDENIVELLEVIDIVGKDHFVTKTELIRDFGFTSSSIRLLERNKQIAPRLESNQRKTYDLAKALRIRVLQPGLLAAKNVKTIRKHNRINTILRDYLNKITDIGI